MAKQLNKTINLAFTADTSDVVTALNKLKQSLGDLSRGYSIKKSDISQITPEIQKGIQAAADLKAKLESATNVNTGKLDLGRFSDSLKKSGMSLQQYATQLNALGPQGRQAFTSLTQSIMQAEAPLVRCNAKLKEFGVSLANTARWQISSSILHGFMGAVSSAYRYAQDLNESLNDIRIVTGYNVDTMEKFAASANKAARNLSTTTNEYVKASLIFFQQGDTEAEAIQKANVVTKMANVTGQSSEVVSNQLTAIWNNFNKAGDQSYEHYADVLTKLGAATASSTDEIAGGLEKFAGIADTIGLSYDYAASALATITATSRESEEVVGTALKTIFARMQGLKLGETLEDGTTLNKYSEALKIAGVDLFDSNQELKTMDALLSEVASKWNTLSKDNQMALAQGVAGIRQYNQFITLMDNWKFMEDNLNTARAATGELSKQSEIYEEGWRAASKRVSAAAENLYTKIIDDDFFIGLLDGFTKVIDGVGGVVDAFGGLKGVLLTVGAFATKIFQKEIAEALRNTAHNIKQFIPGMGAKQDAMRTKGEALTAMQSLQSNETGAVAEAENSALAREITMQTKLQSIAKDLSAEQLKQLQLQMDTVRAMDQRAIAAAKAAEAAKEEAQELEEMTRIYAKLEASEKARKQHQAEQDKAKAAEDNARQHGELKGAEKLMQKAVGAFKGDSKAEFLMTQYEQAEQSVQQNIKTNNLELNDDEIQSRIYQAFIDGIRSAAQDSSDTIIQQFAQEYENAITEAGNAAVQQLDQPLQMSLDEVITQANQKAEQVVADLKQGVDAATGSQVRAKDLAKTAASMTTVDATGATKQPKELAQLHEVLTRKIAATKKEAIALQQELAKTGKKDSGLDDVVTQLASMEKELEDAENDAEKLNAVLQQLQAFDDTKGTVTDQLSETAGHLGREMAVGYFNDSGENSYSEEFFQASKKSKQAEVKSENANADVADFGDSLDESFEKSSQKTADWATGITNATNIVMGLGSAITSVQGAVDVFTNPDASNWDKFSAVMSVLIGLLPVLSTLFTTTGVAGTAAGAGITAAMGPVGWIILAIVAAVAALTAAFIALSNAYNKDAINAKKAAENAEKLAEASQKAKEAVQGIKDGFDAYDTAVEKLNDCVRGTTEWNNALNEVNNSVITLLKTYPHLLAQKDLFSRNEFGMLEINPDKRDEIMEQVEKSAIAAEAAALVGSAKAAQARVQAEKTQTQRDIQGYSNDSFYYSGSSLIENRDKLSGLSSEEFEEELRKIYKKPADMQDWAYENMIKHFSQYQDEIDKLANSTTEAATQMDNAAFLVANAHLGEEYGEIETAAAAEAYEKAQAQIYGEIISQDKENNSKASGAESETAQEIWRRFQAATGTNFKLADNAVQGTDNNRVYAYVDNTGEEQTYTIEYIAETIAASEAISQMTESADAAKEILSELGEKGTSFAAALGAGTSKEAMADYLSNMTQGELDSFGKSITYDADGNAVLSEDSYKALGVTAEQFTTLANTFGITTQELANNLATAQKTVNQSLTDEEKLVFTSNGIDTTNMTIGEQKEFINNRKTFETKAEKAGISAGQMDNIITENKNIDPKQLNDFMTELNGISLNAEDATEQISNLADKYNIQGNSIGNLITSVKALDQAYNVDTRNIADQAKELKEIVGDGLNIGDAISEEDIQKLENAGVDIGTYFTQMSDGTYNLTGKAEEFNNVVKSITLKGLQDQVKDFNINAFQQAISKNPAWREGYIETNLRNTSIAVANDSDANGVSVGTDAIELGYSRLDYINAFDKGTFNFTDEQKKLLEKYNTNPSAAFNQDELKMIAEMMDVVNAKAAELESQMFSSATSIQELQKIANDAGQYSLQSYSEGLINLASQYDNCSTEINELQDALLSNDEALIKTKIEALELSTAIGELSNKYGLDVQDVETHAKLIQASAKDYKLTAQQAANLAVANRRMNKGVQTLNSNWKDWSKVLKSSNKNSIDYADTLNDAHEALADLTGAVDASAIPMDFLDASTESGAEHLEWMSRAAKGDQQAINLLGVALADAQIDAMQFDETMVKMAQDSGLLNKAFDTTAFQTYKDEVLQGVTALQDAIKNGTIAAGQNITELMNGNGETWVDSLNAMALATGMSVEEMNGMLNELGVQAKVDVKSIEQDMEVPTYTEVVKRNPEGIDTDEDGKPDAYGYMRYTIPGPPKRVKGWVQVAQISTEEGSIEPPQITYTGTGGGSVGGGVSPSSTSSGKKGGGGSKPKKTSEAKKKKSEVVERYKEINDQLDDTQTAMDKASKAADRLYGPKRLKEMEKINKALQTEIKQLKEKRKEAEQYLKIDRQDLNKAASALNISFTFDDGNISNYEKAMTSVYNQREALLKSFGSTMDEKEQEQLDAFDKKIEELKAAIEQYDETRELTEDLDNEIQDAINEWQDNNYEQLTYKLELQIEINDRDLEVLEYYLSKTEDDFYKQAEGVGYLIQQFGIYNDKLEDNQNHLEDLQQEYSDGNISQANYIEGLKEIFSATKADAQALADLDKQMLEYYGNTLDMASEEISKYTDRMEHQTSVLEHFKNIMDIIGESTNYEALGVILEGQAQTIENELKVAQETYDFYSNEAAKKKHLMDRAIASGDMEAVELYRQEWEAAEAAAREAQDNMLSKTEEWAEAMKAVLENKLAGLAQTLENALTGGTSFDAITTQMERAASLQEEYLTSTNKIYETNKLINTAQKEIDKTTNTVAKKRLKSFQEETAQLQNKSKLSQYELDIQQAKYELLLAEIALEEAQQAKSTVRLQRDSEGNFGYVYTADANAVADAEQKLADAQNNLYNIGLDGANDYSQKYIQIMQEMHETFSELQQQYLNGEFETEEDYHRAMEDAKAYYFQKLQDYSNLYQVALTTDSRVIADAWSTDFGIMTTKTDDWKKAINGYLDEVNKAFEGWEEVVERVKTETVGQDLDALKDKTQAIVDVSADLSEQITKEGGVIDSIEAEIATVSAITSSYAQWRKEIAATITENEKLMHQTKMILDEQADGKSSKDGNLKTDNKDKSNTTTDSTGASGNNNTSSKQPSLVDGSKVTVKKTARHFSRDGGNGTKMQDWVPGYTFTVIDIDGNEVLIGKGNSYSQATGWVRKTDLEGFKTGGYTGSWGSEGKLAMLHQKELILNANDTSNFLASLEVLREIMKVIDLHSSYAQISGMLTSPAYRDYNEPQTLEQQVHIEASFPNVQDRHEIEEAFTNLVNRASQFVNRK